MNDIKQIKVKADIILNATNDTIISKKSEDDIIIQAEQKLNSLVPLNIIVNDGQHVRVGIRVHVKERC